MPNYGDDVTVEGLRSFAKEAEELGYDSLWCTDHILMNATSGTPYERILESVTTLSYVAAATAKARLGISAMIIAMRNPVIAAKQLATIDFLSNGRLTLAVGTGWAKREFDFLGADFGRRGRRLDESLKLLKSLWSGRTSFHGLESGVKAQRAVFEPRPVQKELPVWVAGNSEPAMKRAIRLGDAWHPNVYELEEFEALTRSFRLMAGGRRKSISVRIALGMNSRSQTYTSHLGERRLILTGDPERTGGVLDRLKALGVTYVVLTPNFDGRASIGDQLQSIRSFAQDVAYH